MIKGVSMSNNFVIQNFTVDVLNYTEPLCDSDSCYVKKKKHIEIIGSFFVLFLEVLMTKNPVCRLSIFNLAMN